MTRLLVVTAVAAFVGLGCGAPTPSSGVQGITAPAADQTATIIAPLAKAPTAKPAPPPARPPARATARPTARPTSRPASTCGAPANPWGYNFCGGGYVTSPSTSICDYFNCIASFWDNTKGYVAECTDGTYTHSGGRYGVCTDHGTQRRPLYS